MDVGSYAGFSLVGFDGSGVGDDYRYVSFGEASLLFVERWDFVCQFRVEYKLVCGGRIGCAGFSAFPLIDCG